MPKIEFKGQKRGSFLCDMLRLQDLPRSDPRLLAVVLLLVVVRIPALMGPINLSQDATEYIDIARNVAHGEGLVLKIRAYFFSDGYTLPYPSTSLRSPLFPFLMGKVYSLVPSVRVFQWFNFVLFLVNMSLLVLILRRMLPFRIVAWSVLLIGLTEPMFVTSIFPWAEQTAFFWLLLCVQLACVGLHRRWGAAGALLEGLAAAMAALSRPEYMLVSVLFLCWLTLRHPRHWSPAAVFLLGFLLPLAAVSGISYHNQGRLFLPGDYLFRRGEYAAYFSWESAGSRRVAEFVASNWAWIAYRVVLNFVNYIAKLIGWKDLFALAAALPLVLWTAVHGRYDRQRQLLALVPAAFLAAYCLIWAGIDRERYLLAVTTFWLPLCVLEVDNWRRTARSRWTRFACTGVLAANLPLLLGYTISSDIKMLSRAAPAERFYARENAAWSNPDMASLANWVRSNVGQDEILCLENPFLLNFQTGGPALLLPVQIRPDEFVRFLEYYKVRFWVNNEVFTKYPREGLAALANAVRQAGARRVAQCGTYQVWRMP